MAAEDHPEAEVLRLRAQVAALEELLGVQEQAVLLQSDRLEQALGEVVKHSGELERINRELKTMIETMMNREERVLELKKEINDLLAEFHRPPKYGG